MERKIKFSFASRCKPTNEEVTHSADILRGSEWIVRDYVILDTLKSEGGRWYLVEARLALLNNNNV